MPFLYVNSHDKHFEQIKNAFPTLGMAYYKTSNYLVTMPGQDIGDVQHAGGDILRDRGH